MTNFNEDLSAGAVKSSQGSGDSPISPKEFKYLSNIVIGVLVASVGIVITLLFQLGAIWIDHFDSKRATYEDLRDEVEEQNRVLNNFINNYEIQERQNRVATST